MIFSRVVLAPLGEVPETLPVVRLVTQKYYVSVYAVVSVELLATTHQAKTLPLCCQILCWLGICITDITEVNPLSLL
jgi:hypothetical protein